MNKGHKTYYWLRVKGDNKKYLCYSSYTPIELKKYIAKSGRPMELHYCVTDEQIPCIRGYSELQFITDEELKTITFPPQKCWFTKFSSGHMKKFFKICKGE